MRLQHTHTPACKYPVCQSLCNSIVYEWRDMCPRCLNTFHGGFQIFGVVREDEENDGTSGEEFAGLMDEVAAYRFKVRELARAILKCPESAKETATELLSMSDTFRDNSMVELGIRLEDKGDRGFIWKLSSKADILAERARRANEEASANEVKAARQAEMVRIYHTTLSHVICRDAKPFCPALVYASCQMSVLSGQNSGL